MARRNHSLVVTLFAMIAALIGAILWGGDPGGRSSRSRSNGPPGDDPTAAPSFVATGRLVAQGQPVAGAVLEFRPLSIPRSSGSDAWDFLLTGSVAGRRKATTDGDGRFRLEFASAVRGELVFEQSEAFLFADATGSPVAQWPLRPTSWPVDLGEFRIYRTQRLVGVVVDEDGGAVDGASVRVAREDRRESTPQSARTGPDGAFELPGLAPVPYVLRTEAEGFRPLETAVPLTPGRQPGDLRLVLARGVSVSGRVVDDRGVGVAEARVEGLGGEGQGGEGDPQITQTDRYGFFELSGLGGEVVLRASAAGHWSSAPRTVEAERTGLLLQVDRLATLSGTLLVGNGEPVVGSQVLARTVGGGRKARVTPSATTDENGEFVIEGVVPGTVELLATGSGHLPLQMPSPLQVRPGQVLEHLRLRAVRAAELSVDVFDLEGEPVGGAVVELQPIGIRGPGATIRRVADGGGRVVFSGLSPERVRVVSRHPDYSESRPVELRLSSAVRKTVLLTLLPIGSILCEFRSEPDPDRPSRVRLTQGDSVVEVDVTALRLEIPGLTPATWSVQMFERIDGRWVTLGEPVDVEVEARTTVAVRLP